MTVVVTGMGLVTPLGVGRENVWARILAGESGIRKIQGFDIEKSPTKIAGQIPDLEEHLKNIIDPKDAKKMGRFIKASLVATREALEDADILSQEGEILNISLDRTGVLVGSGIGGLGEIDESSIALQSKGRVSPFFVPSALINLPGGHISIKWGFRGPNFSVVSACASGAHAIGEAAKMISSGQADVMIVGGTEAAICRLGLAGFSSMKALSTAYNETPEKASRPWDSGRDGFVMGEGAGILILESLEHAQKRKAPKIYARLAGYGLSCDAHHIAQPLENGAGAKASMIMALESAGIKAEDIGYINAHATSTPLGDVAELKAIESLFGKETCVSSTKGATGHLLGAAGAVEAIFCILALRDHILPPTINLEDPETSQVPLIGPKPHPKDIKMALSNSFGFGGANASLIFEIFEKKPAQER